MPYGRVDDRAHWNPKVRNARMAVRGVVFGAALPYCASGLTDGVLHRDFVDDHVRGRDARVAFRGAIEAGFIHPAGELCGRCLTAVAQAGVSVVDGDHYLHAYLEHNPTKAEVERRRERDRTKKQSAADRRKQDTLPWSSPGESPHSPSRSGVGENSNGNGSRTDAPAPRLSDQGTVVDQVLQLLNGCRRFTVDDIDTRTAVENAIALHPDRDPIAAARTAVVWASDPAWNTTAAATVLLHALRKQEPGEAPRGVANAAAYRDGDEVECPDCQRRHNPNEAGRRFSRERRCDSCYERWESRQLGDAESVVA